MRVISGKWKGKRLTAREGIFMRPTLDRVKETVFNVLMPYIYGVSFLDLFAGSGAMGIEALSRGAYEAVFVEHDKESVHIIRKNLKNVDTDAVIIQLDALDAVNELGKRGLSFHIIFLDPPYAYDYVEDIFLRLLAFKGILHKEAIIVWEHEKNKMVNVPEEFILIKEKRASKTCVSFYKYIGGKL